MLDTIQKNEVTSSLQPALTLSLVDEFEQKVKQRREELRYSPLVKSDVFSALMKEYEEDVKAETPFGQFFILKRAIAYLGNSITLQDGTYQVMNDNRGKEYGKDIGYPRLIFSFISPSAICVKILDRQRNEKELLVFTYAEITQTSTHSRNLNNLLREALREYKSINSKMKPDNTIFASKYAFNNSQDQSNNNNNNPVCRP